jgi:hypothetical protein
MAYLQNLQNSSLKATGYALVQIEDTSLPQLIVIGLIHFFNNN